MNRDFPAKDIFTMFKGTKIEKMFQEHKKRNGIVYKEILIDEDSLVEAYNIGEIIANSVLSALDKKSVKLDFKSCCHEVFLSSEFCSEITDTGYLSKTQDKTFTKKELDRMKDFTRLVVYQKHNEEIWRAIDDVWDLQGSPVVKPAKFERGF